MSVKYAAFGTLLKRGNGQEPEEFVTIGGIANISGPGMTVDTLDATAHDSPGGFEEVIASFIRTSEVTLEVRFDPSDTEHQGLLDDLKSRVKRNFQVVFPDADETTWTFSAFVTAYELTAPHDGLLGLNVTLKPTGPIEVEA